MCHSFWQRISDHEPIITYNEGKYDDRKLFHWIDIVPGDVTNAFHGTYHAVSVKHLPRYLSEFCCRFNRRFQLDTMVNRPAYVALRNQPVRQRLLNLAEDRY